MKNLNCYFYHLVFILFIFNTAIIFCQNPANDILYKAYEKLKKYKSVEYNAAIGFKFLSEDDTIKLNGKVFLTKNFNDTIFKANIWLSANDSTFKFYDLKSIYDVNTKQKSVTKYDPHKGQSWIITGNNIDNILWNSFLNPEKFKKFTDSSNLISLLNDTLINNKKCYQIIIKQPDENDFSDNQWLLLINQSDFVPIVSNWKIKFQDNYQIDNFKLIDYSFDNVRKEKYSLKQIPRSYKIDTYKPEVNKSDYKLLDSGNVSPQITGKNYRNDMKLDTIHLKGIITLLDFWYTSCFPCIKAIPEIEKLNDKYQDKIQIIGINCYDNNERGVSRFPKFLKNNKINYKILLTEKVIPEKYKIKAWPTFYIIDKNGFVYYTKQGFSINLYDELDNVLNTLLKK